MSDSNLIAKLTKLLHLDKDKIIDHIAEMGVDNVLEVVDALNNDDADRARELLGVEEDDTAAGQDVEADATPEQDVEDEADDEDDVRISPLFRAVAKGSAKNKNKHLQAVEEDDYVPNIGDDVIVGGEEGTVKIAKAPADTVGVQIDGEMTMVKKDKVQRGQVSESIMGMAPMADLRRIQQLAGISFGGESNEIAPPSITSGGEASTAVTSGLEKDQETCEEMDDGTDWLSELQTKVARIMGDYDLPQDAETAVTAVAAGPLDSAGLDCPLDAEAAKAVAASAVGAESPHSKGAPCLDFGGVLKSFDEIEAGLPELRVKDAKIVRQRLNALMAKLNETRFTYKPKA